MFTAPLTLIAFRFLCCLCLIFVYTPRGTAVVLLLNSILLRSSYLFYGCIVYKYNTAVQLYSNTAVQLRGVENAQDTGHGQYT